MSTAIQALQAQIQAELSRLRDAMPAPASNKIQVTQTKQFKFPDGTISTEPFEAIILDWRWVNTLYAGNYNPTAREAPLCWAVSNDSRNMTPGAGCGQKQADACVTCPKNQFGSAGRGKACKNTLRIALVPPDATTETQPWTLTVSPTGLKNFIAYETPIREAWGKLPIQVITKIGFNPKEAYPNLLFQLVEEHDNLATAFKLREIAQSALDREFD